MIIKNVEICDFGAISAYNATLSPELNILSSPYDSELAAAVDIFLCNKARNAVPPLWLRPGTRLAAEIAADSSVFTVTATFRGRHLTLTATDALGNDATEEYRHLLSHCREQDSIERFDGRDNALPSRLFEYRNCDDLPINLSRRTANLSDTRVFRAYLNRYIKAFQPEPIHCRSAYLAAMDASGKFHPFYPDLLGAIALSETEQKLFLYTCFLNIAEFWAGIQAIRDMHHEKKPLLIQNFLEFLDASADIDSLMARTVSLQRQIILLAPPMDADKIKQWEAL